MKKDLLSIADLKPIDVKQILFLAQKLKREQKRKNTEFLPKGKILAMIFEKPSLRTRVSFEVGMHQLGGHAIYLTSNDIQMGKRESISDTGHTLERYVDGIMARVFDHRTILELAKHIKIPVINGLSDLEHPCQILGDLLTILENKNRLKNLKIAFVGDGENNVTHSLALACSLLGMDFFCASPKGYKMNKEIVKKAKKLAFYKKTRLIETENPKLAAKNADIIYTDTWVSMGDEAEKEKRLKIFLPYRVDSKLMSYAKKDAIFMHDLPAYRDNEVTPEVIDGSKSVIFDQAENRLHAQKAVLVSLLKKNK